jgi:cellulose synthase/poly-beta-1,6-N-acetylglucosamine synthase-like glycosyltransferase
MRRMTPNVSVIVPTYRRDDLLNRCLAALLPQEFAPAAYEVIVCDDAASEATRHVVETWAARSCISVRYLPICGTRGPAAARNSGWRAARGTIIAFTDDDCIPQPGWLRAGVRAFAACDRAPSPEHEGVVMGICGRIIVPLRPTPTDYERDAAGLESAEFATANCFYRRDALEDVGGFDERFTAAWREDADLLFTLIERGYRCGCAPDAVVVHPVRPARWGVSIQQQRKSMFNALLYKKHPALYRQRIQAMPPLRYYGAVGALLAMLAAMVSGRGRLALFSGGVWLLLTGRFCAQRLHGASHAPQHIAEMAVTSIVIPPLSIFWRVRGAFTFRVLFC